MRARHLLLAWIVLFTAVVVFALVSLRTLANENRRLASERCLEQQENRAAVRRIDRNLAVIFRATVQADPPAFHVPVRGPKLERAYRKAISDFEADAARLDPTHCRDTLEKP